MKNDPYRPKWLDQPLVSKKELSTLGGCLAAFLLLKLAFWLALIAGGAYIIQHFI